MPSDHGGHNANGSCTRDNDVFPHHIERQGGMGCVAVRVKNSQNVTRYVNTGPENICGGNREVFCEGAITVYTHAFCIRTQV